MVSGDPFIRQHTLMILKVLAMQPHGKMAIVKNKVVMKNLSNLLGDDDNVVRLTAAQTALSLAMWYFGKGVSKSTTLQNLLDFNNTFFVCSGSSD